MKAKTHTARSRSVKRSGARPTARRASKRAAGTLSVGKTSGPHGARKPAGKSADKSATRKATARRVAGKPAGKPSARRAAPGRSAGKRAAPRRTGAGRSSAGRWLAFVERHGVVLASARGPVPSVAEAVAGQPIVGSWWAHPKGRAIFAALSEIDDADDVRCFKLIDGKVTFVHRRVWPALACLAASGSIDAARAAAIQQEHMPTGEHRNLVTPYPDWVPDDVARAAAELTVEDARAQLGGWL